MEATLSGVAGAKAEAVDANAARKIADRNFMLFVIFRKNYVVVEAR